MNDYTMSAVGGLLIGAGIGVVYLAAGRMAGISSILTAAHSIWSRRPYFLQDWVRDDLRWKGALVLGLLAGAGATALLVSGPYVTTVQPWRLALGGVFVGFGTRWARGCTSGHGICGIAATSLPSLVSTVTFVGSAMAVAYCMALAGVRP